jgi:hypothetical protein
MGSGSALEIFSIFLVVVFFFGLVLRFKDEINFRIVMVTPSLMVGVFIVEGVFSLIGQYVDFAEENNNIEFRLKVAKGIF